jgi:hypothetical protein
LCLSAKPSSFRTPTSRHWPAPAAVTDLPHAKPGELKAALSEALAVDGPAIVDAVVVADEMPNMPHVELEQIGNYAVAKIKEAVLAVTGG